MAFSTLMVHLELEHPNDARLQIAGELAERFDSRLIGIAACDPRPNYTDGASTPALVDREWTTVKNRMAEAEARFRTAVQHRACEIEWRSALVAPTAYVANEARAADLVITGS